MKALEDCLLDICAVIRRQKASCLELIIQILTLKMMKKAVFVNLKSMFWFEAKQKWGKTNSAKRIKKWRCYFLSVRQTPCCFLIQWRDKESAQEERGLDSRC